MRTSNIIPVFMMLLFAACSTEEKIMPDAQLSIADEQIAVAAEGGEYTFAYTLDNPSDASDLRAECNADWINVSEGISDGMVSFSVSANETYESRSSEIVLVYSDEAGIELSDSITVIQSASSDNVQNVKASDLIGSYKTESDYYYTIYLSESGFQSGSFVAGATYYQFDFHAGSEPADYSKIQIPVGEYDMENMAIAQYFVVNSDASGYSELNTLTDVKMTVSESGDGVSCVIEAADEAGMIHKIEYAGEHALDLYSKDGLRLINYNTETVDPFITYANYVSDSNGTMRLSIAISGTPEGGDYENPFSMLYIDMYAPFDKAGVAAGTYTFSDSGESFTLGKGAFSADASKPSGTYVYDFSEDGARAFGLAVSGSITVEKDENSGIYTLTCNLGTAEGFEMNCVYEGEFSIPDIPGASFSTLTEDYTVDLHDAGPFCCFYGDKFGNGTGYFSMSLCGEFVKDDPNSYIKSGEGEEVYFEFVSDDPEYSGGIPSGTYVAGSTTPEAFQYIPGYKNEDLGVIFGTHYIGAYKDGYISRCAPAISGDLVIDNHGDGTYTISFSFVDDRGNTWDGVWTGSMMVFNFS